MIRNGDEKPKGIGRISRGGGVLGEVSLAFMVVSISYDVVMRYVFAAPTHWALEVNTFLLVFLCVIPAADVLQAGGHIRITFATDRMRSSTRNRLNFLRAAAGICFCFVMSWKGSVMAWQAWAHNDRMSTSLGTPMVIPYLFLPIGFGLLCIQYLAVLADKKRKPGERGAETAGEFDPGAQKQI